MPMQVAERDEIDALLQRAHQLHSAPLVAQSILKLTSVDDFDIDEVVECIECDPALASRLLRIVNSSRYGLRHPVTNIRQAIAYLGQRTLRLIAMTFSIVEVFRQGPAKQLYGDYWQHAMTMATAGGHLSGRGDGLDPHDAYTAGLLADLGTLLFAQAKQETYIAMYRAARTGADLVRAEQEQFGFDHAALGARLLEQWELPSPICRAIREHHRADGAEDPLTRIVRGGDLVAEVLWKPVSDLMVVARVWLEQHFALRMDEFADLALNCRDEVMREAEVYGIHLDQTIDFDALLQEARRAYLDMSLEAAMDLDSLTAAMDGPALL